MTVASTIEPAPSSPASCFSLLALVLLGTRFVQGFIFWGGASRQLFYDFHEIDGVDFAVKLDFNSAGFVANKLTHALPGALWAQRPIEWTLQHPDLILTSVWMWTFAELAVSLGLIFGFATRLAALVSIGLALMLIFGWMGSTCLNERTMAVSGVAMSSAVFLAAGGAWSLDSLIERSGWAEHNPPSPAPPAVRDTNSIIDLGRDNSVRISHASWQMGPSQGSFSRPRASPFWKVTMR